eukprot:6185818-Pleurochrysis_carterae.AAC.1
MHASARAWCARQCCAHAFVNTRVQTAAVKGRRLDVQTPRACVHAHARGRVVLHVRGLATRTCLLNAFPDGVKVGGRLVRAQAAEQSRGQLGDGAC